MGALSPSKALPPLDKTIQMLDQAMISDGWRLEHRRHVWAPIHPPRPSTVPPTASGIASISCDVLLAGGSQPTPWL